MTDYTIYCDGGKKPNEPAYGRFMIEYKGVSLDPAHVELPKAKTNNQAEYSALIAALECIPMRASGDGAVESVRVYTDSLLMASQINGTWKINDPALFKLCSTARSLLAQFREWQIKHIDRSQIQRVLGC